MCSVVGFEVYSGCWNGPRTRLIDKKTGRAVVVQERYLLSARAAESTIGSAIYESHFFEVSLAGFLLAMGPLFVLLGSTKRRVWRHWLGGWSALAISSFSCKSGPHDGKTEIKE